MSELEHIKPIIQRIVGGLMSEKLCWKCRESITAKFGEAAYFMPYQHCHHPEPEEKPKEKCWCEYETDDILGGIIIQRSSTGFPTEKREVIYCFCPECGEKIP